MKFSPEEALTNLIRDPWIPIRRASGEEVLAPWQVTDRLADDPVLTLASPRADFDGALAQFLIGLLQTALAPKSGRDWRRRFDLPPTPDELREAFEPLAPFFELFGDGPRFLQDLTLEKGGGFEELPIERLLVESPGENTLKLGKDHFVKAGRIGALCPSCAATALLTLQVNGPSGGQGHRTGLRGGGPLTTLVVHPESLWHTLWLNVLPDGSLPGNPARDQPEDRFPWLAPTRTSGKDGRETTAEDVHPLQMYWAMPRRLRLRPDPSASGPCGLCEREGRPLTTKAITRNLGVNYTGPWRHPLTPHREDKEGNLLPLHGSPAGLSYRQWLGLVQSHDEGGLSPARVVAELKSDPSRSDRADYRLWAFGYDMDNMKARAWLDGTMPLILAEPEHREDFEREVQRLILAARIAERALGYAARDLGGDAGDVGPRFWQETEAPFYSRLQPLRDAVERGEDADDIRTGWHRLLVRTAHLIFDDASGNGHFEARDPRQVARAWRKLQNSLHDAEMRGILALPSRRPTDEPTPIVPERP